VGTIRKLFLFAALWPLVSPAASQAASETYRLVHAIGNSEKVIAKGLEKGECARRKREHIKITEALGVHSERLGKGSITCLPESYFEER